MSTPAEDRLLARRPPQVLAKLPANSQVCLLNSKDILTVLKAAPVIVMACNTRIKHVIPGIMRAAQELDAVVAFELARSECSLEGGYTGFTPQLYAETVIGYAQETKFTKPFFIHADHITVKSTAPEAIASARELIEAQLAAGYTSFAIDASFNELPDNIQITTQLAQPIVKHNLGLEVEVGEIKSTGQEAEITTVAEAVDFIKGLRDNGVYPDLLAINNGSKHGNYLEGEKISIDLERTGDDLPGHQRIRRLYCATRCDRNPLAPGGSVCRLWHSQSQRGHPVAKCCPCRLAGRSHGQDAGLGLGE